MNNSYGDWYTIFVWFPIATISGKRKWLTTVYARKILCKPLLIEYTEYGDLLDVMRNLK